MLALLRRTGYYGPTYETIGQGFLFIGVAYALVSLVWLLRNALKPQPKLRPGYLLANLAGVAIGLGLVAAGLSLLRMPK
jgi:hypothetical protein